MQDQVLAHSLGVCEVFEIYNPAIRQTQKIHGNADYQVSRKRTKKKNGYPSRFQLADAADQTLLPLHFSFCRTTLKNEASGNEASGSVLFAFRIVTTDSRSTWIGLRPSSVRNTG